VGLNVTTEAIKPGTAKNGGDPRGEILVVDDDRELVELLAFLVEQAGHVPLRAYEPKSAIELFEKEDPALVIIDLNMAPWDGFELLGDLRQRNEKTPIIVLTGRNSEDDKVRALDLGADDYIVKPFGHRELLARIRAHARRAASDRVTAPLPAVLEVGLLRLDVNEHSLQLNDQTLHLTGTEFRLLQYLMRNVNSVVPTSALAKHIWGYDDPPARDAVRVTVHRLRRKLGDDGTNPRFIQTVPGVGLKLRPN
jgi:DNA-binding response OmpR family regulator